MSILPPVEKLSLAVRKNLRDEYDSKKADLEKELSDALTTEWTIDVNPNALFPYAKESWQAENFGRQIANYISGAVEQLQSFAKDEGEGGITELNAVAFTHSLTIEPEPTTERFNTCGCDIKEGKLRVLFTEPSFGYNTGSTLEELKKRINEADAPEGASPLSFAVRSSISSEYEPKIGEVKDKIAGLLQNEDVKLSPNWEDNFALLKSEGCGTRGWDERMGYFTLCYFEGVAEQLESQKFGEDDMLREGFGEAVPTGEISVKVVDKLEKGHWNEAVIKDGVLCIQTTPANFGVNTSQPCEGLVDLL